MFLKHKWLENLNEVSNIFPKHWRLRLLSVQERKSRFRSEQRAVARTKCSRLCRIFQNKLCIMNDESYFTLAHTSINGNDRFYTSDFDSTPATVKYSPTAKYEKNFSSTCAFLRILIELTLL